MKAKLLERKVKGEIKIKWMKKINVLLYFIFYKHFIKEKEGIISFELYYIDYIFLYYL